jgi:hypothetical protein
MTRTNVECYILEQLDEDRFGLADDLNLGYIPSVDQAMRLYKGLFPNSTAWGSFSLIEIQSYSRTLVNELCARIQEDRFLFDPCLAIASFIDEMYEVSKNSNSSITQKFTSFMRKGSLIVLDSLIKDGY